MNQMIQQNLDDLENPKIKLDKEQTRIIDLFLGGHNLFITGGGGTGKSFLIEQIHQKFVENKMNGEIALTSTTGLSSLNIKGMTIHSWAGITPKTDIHDIDSFIRNIKNNNRLATRWRFTNTLVIDEISMLNAEMLDFLNIVAKKIRDSVEPFGGIQLILTGDFLQLPPVSKTGNDFCFKAKCWNDIIDFTIILKKCYRQDKDKLIKFLDKIRYNKIDTNVEEQLEQYKNNPNYDDNYTHLYPTRNGVDSHNLLQLSKLSGDTFTNIAKLIPKPSLKKLFEKGDDSVKFPSDSSIVESLSLKEGAFIIITKNIDPSKGLVNGRQGIFLKSIKDEGLMIETLDGNKHVISIQSWEFNSYHIEQYPLRLAWALTIHKSQGMGIEKLSVDIGAGIFSNHQVYVALSRATSDKYLHIKSYSITSISNDSEVLSYYNNLKSESKKWILKRDEDGNILYQNKINGKCVRKVPKKGILIEDVKKLEIENNVLVERRCQYCDINAFNREYETFFGEKICSSCISKDSNFRLMNKTDLYTHFKNNISKKSLKTLFDNDELLYKPQSGRFGKCKLYLLKHVDQRVNETSKQITSNLETYFNKSISSNPEAIFSKSLVKDDETVSINILYKKLKMYRAVTSKQKNQPPFCVFTNKVLDEICIKIPTDETSLLSISGIGTKKLQEYGKSIIGICEEFKLMNIDT